MARLGLQEDCPRRARRSFGRSGRPGIPSETSPGRYRSTMPNGQKYEDWLKSRGEENSGS